MENSDDIVVPIRLSVTEELFSISEAAGVGRQIGASQQKAAAQALETANLCELAFKKYRSHGLDVVLRWARMNRSTFMKYVAIASDPRLRRIEALLPPSYSIIHQISLLTDQTFDEAV